MTGHDDGSGGASRSSGGRTGGGRTSRSGAGPRSSGGGRGAKGSCARISGSGGVPVVEAEEFARAVEDQRQRARCLLGPVRDGVGTNLYARLAERIAHGPR